MEKEGLSYEAALKIAQEKFAEADPTSDVKVTMQLIN